MIQVVQMPAVGSMAQRALWVGSGEEKSKHISTCSSTRLDSPALGQGDLGPPEIHVDGPWRLEQEHVLSIWHSAVLEKEGGEDSWASQQWGNPPHGPHESSISLSGEVGLEKPKGVSGNLRKPCPGKPSAF